MPRKSTRERITRYEGIVIQSIPWRERWAFYRDIGLAQPHWLWSYARHRFSMWTVLPGDRVICVVRDMYGEVLGVDTRGMRLQVESGMYRAYRKAGVDLRGAVPAYEFVPRNDGRWLRHG